MDIKPSDTVVVPSDSPVGSSESIAESPRVVEGGYFGGVGRMSVSSMDAPMGGGKIMERCRFWPNCKLGAACQYQHPTINCK